MSERRLFERVKIHLSGSIENGDTERALTRPSIAVLDLSLGGAYCQIDRFISPLTTVMLSLNFLGESHEETAACRGVVVRVEPEKEMSKTCEYNVGIIFTEISREDREKLQNFLERQVDKNSG